MSADPISLTIDTRDLLETAGQMCAGYERLEGFLRGLFGDFDALAGDLERREQLVDSNRREQDAQWSQREERLQRERQEIEATFEQTQKLAEQLGASAVAGAGESTRLAELLAGLEEERSTFRLALEASESQRQEQLSRERQEIEATFEQTQKLAEQLGAAAAAGAGESTRLAELFASLEEERSTFRVALEASESQRQEQLVRERRELEATFEKIQKLTGQLEASAVAGRGEGGQFDEILAGLDEERAVFRAAMEAANVRDAELTRMADDLAAARRELADTRQELAAQRELLSLVPNQSGADAAPEIRERLERLEQEGSAWGQERAILENELDTVRTRAAELADSLDDERQRALKERNDWAEELSQMRQLLQVISDRSAESPRPAALAAPAEMVSAPVEDAQDPVLDSVMAQFEILQKDLARRRKAKPVAK